MNPVADAFLSSWPFDPGLLVGLLFTTAIYLRGWISLRRRDAQRWRIGKPAAFLCGLAAIFLALASPIEPFSFLFLQVHMLQHLLLMMVAPPLLWLGDPLFPILRGLPVSIRTFWVAPWFRSPALRHFFGWLTHPVRAWLLYVGTAWVWHLPALYDLALRSDGWHYVQHLMFLGTALLFWYPVVRPYPSHPHWSRWLLIPYLLLADVQNTVLAALLTFSDVILYRHYELVPRLGGLSALDDQATAGVIMWVPGSLVYLVPLFWIVLRSLFGVESGVRSQESGVRGQGSGVRSQESGVRSQESGVRSQESGVRGQERIPLSLVTGASTTRFDLLRVPGLGAFLRRRHARLCLQIPLLLLAGAVIYDGLSGPEIAPMNLAGVLPWIHWRGLLIIGLLIVGNVFCMACPFMLPRMLARRVFSQPFAWPRRLRNKWLAALLLVSFLWSYEAFALWDSSWLTAWIAIGYFVGALVVDGLFRGAAFCKYVCPIGQFNFVQSLLSPWEVKVRDADVCTKCQTKDCIRGHPATTGDAPTPAARGCELDLFLPRKSSNVDCTLCLDCIHACPHDNIGIIAVAPGNALWKDPQRSGIGRFSKRADLAALVLLLVFGAFANAAGMVGPVAERLDQLRMYLGHQTPLGAVSAYYVSTLIILPLMFVGVATALSHWWGKLSTNWRDTGVRYVYSLAPLGFAMWLGHYSFHLLTSYDSAVPAFQRFVNDMGGDLGSPDWVCNCCRPVGNWIPRLEILFLDVGLLLSLYTAYRISLAGTPDMARALGAMTPWALLIVFLFAAGIWIVLQPMQMRGTMLMGG